MVLRKSARHSGKGRRGATTHPLPACWELAQECRVYIASTALFTHHIAIVAVPPPPTSFLHSAPSGRPVSRFTMRKNLRRFPLLAIALLSYPAIRDNGVGILYSSNIGAGATSQPACLPSIALPVSTIGPWPSPPPKHTHSPSLIPSSVSTAPYLRRCVGSAYLQATSLLLMSSRTCPSCARTPTSRIAMCLPRRYGAV